MKTKNFKFKTLALVLFALVLSSNVWGEEVTLTNAQIVAGTGNTSYGNCSATDGDGNTWNAYAIKNHHSSATSSYKFWQIKKYASNTAYYVQVPEMPGNITQIRLTVSSTQQPMTGGGNSATLYFSSSNSTSSTGTGVVSGTGASSITLNTSSLNLTEGYITASGALRIWEITVAYSAGPSCTTSPTVSAGSVSGATTSSLTFNCSGGITSLGSTGCSITEYGYVYGTSSNPTTSNTKYKVGESYTTTGTAFAAYTANGLNCGTTYYMRPYAINGNGTAYGAQATLATSACLVDHFIDNVQETDGYTGDGKAVSTSFTKASITLSDKAAATSGSCEEVHYHFVGWVTAADRSAGNVDAEHIVNFQDSGNTPTGTTYYAVWAAEEQ